MEKKETNTLSIFQRPVWVSLFALTAAISWGWAYPLIKMGMEEYQITADMTGSKMLFAGIRFFISGIIILAIARSSHRKFGFKKNAVQKENHDVQKNGSFSFLTNTNVWFLSSIHSSTPPFIMLSSISDSRIMLEHVRRYSIR